MNDHCDLCGIQLYLVERNAELCTDCHDKLLQPKYNYLSIGIACSWCGREHTYKFLCNICCTSCCDSCVHEHTCEDPDDFPVT